MSSAYCHAGCITAVLMFLWVLLLSSLTSLLWATLRAFNTRNGTEIHNMTISGLRVFSHVVPALLAAKCGSASHVLGEQNADRVEMYSTLPLAVFKESLRIDFFFLFLSRWSSSEESSKNVQSKVNFDEIRTSFTLMCQVNSPYDCMFYIWDGLAYSVEFKKKKEIATLVSLLFLLPTFLAECADDCNPLNTSSRGL